MKYAIIDTEDNCIKNCFTYSEALAFISLKGRLDWRIVKYTPADYKSTPKQRSAVKWCEHILGIKFKGNINSGLSCSNFLYDYLNLAKQTYTELKCEYEVDKGY